MACRSLVDRIGRRNGLVASVLDQRGLEYVFRGKATV